MSALVLEAFARRRAPVEDLGRQAPELAAASKAVAERFSRGGRLLVFGNGGGSTDAQHIAVEFVHPVIVGKRALPALSLVSDAATLMGVAARSGLDEVYAHQIRVLGRPDDIALGISVDGECCNVRSGLAAAKKAGMLTVALVGGNGDPGAEHTVRIPSEDPLIVKEGHVTAYHLLWELVHVFLDTPEAPAQTVGVESLYPFLYSGGSASVVKDVAESIRQKVLEVLELRAEVGRDQAAALATCANELAAAFAGGATLLAFGNGGSSTDAQDAVHTFLDPPPPGLPRPALGLTNDVAVVTAMANDVGFEVVFSRQVQAFGRPGDIALALSTSGASHNVLAGLDAAAAGGLITVGLAGSGGGRMAMLPSLRHLFTVPSLSVHRVQEVQTTLYHVLWQAVADSDRRSPM